MSLSIKRIRCDIANWIAFCPQRKKVVIRNRFLGGNSQSVMQLGAFVLLFLVSVGPSRQYDDFCNRYLNNDTAMPSFTKRLNSELHALLNMYKELPCCARGFDRIDWFKDNIPLSEEHSSFKRNEMLRSQMIESLSVRRTDAGLYRCEVWNNSNPNPLILNISLSVKVTANYTERPESLTDPEDVYVLEGDSAVFKALAIVGDHRESIVFWSKNGTSFINNSSRTVVINERKHPGAVLSTLTIYDVVEEDYTDYICLVDNGTPPPLRLGARLIKGDKRKVVNSYKFAFVIVGIFSVSFFIVTSTVKVWSLELRLLFKDRFGKLEVNDDKEYDVFVCYDPEDANFTLEVLVPTLENVYKYRCFAYERDSLAGEWIPETYTSGVRASRRFLMVLSPALATNNWCTYALYIAIEAMLNLHSKIICIELEEIPWNELAADNSSSNDTILRQVLSVVKKVRWEIGPDVAVVDGNGQDAYGPGTDRFWKNLRLHLPPRREMPRRFSTESQQSLMIDY